MSTGGVSRGMVEKKIEKDRREVPDFGASGETEVQIWEEGTKQRRHLKVEKGRDQR